MNRLRRLLFENWEFKLFALMLTLVLFRYVRGTQERNISVEVQLDFKYPKSLILTSEVKSKVMVLLRGPDLQLRQISKKKLKHTIHLPKATNGLVRHQFYEYQFTNLFSAETKVIRFRPSALDFMFARRVKKKLPRVITFVGKEPIGYKLIRPVKPFPPTIILEGPDYVLDGVKVIETKPIDLTGLSRDIVRSTTIEQLGGFVKALGPLKTKVKLRFRKVMKTKVIKNFRVQLLNVVKSKLKWTLKPANVDLKIFGPLAQLHVMKRKDVTVEVDGSKISTKTNGVYRLPLRVRFSAPDIKLLKAPRTVVVQTTLIPPPAPRPTLRKAPGVRGVLSPPLRAVPVPGLNPEKRRRAVPPPRRRAVRKKLKKRSRRLVKRGKRKKLRRKRKRIKRKQTKRIKRKPAKRKLTKRTSRKRSKRKKLRRKSSRTKPPAVRKKPKRRIVRRKRSKRPTPVPRRSVAPSSPR
jgi:YbbR domain-containing protein